MRIGAHVRSSSDPLGDAADLGADIVQLFVTDPQKWSKPAPHPQTAALRESGVDVVVHSSYVINVASLNNRLRMPSRKAVAEQAAAAAELGAIGLVVHGGHVRDNEDAAQGYLNWRKLFERQADKGGFGVPILIENTAGGENAMARFVEDVERLWLAVGDFGDQVGFCLDTCHAWAAGLELGDLVTRVKAATGRIDLVHLNNSRDEFGSARDRHAPLDGGQIPTVDLLAVAAEAGAPVVLETPAETIDRDLRIARGVLGA